MLKRIAVAVLLPMVAACEFVDDDIDKHTGNEPYVALDEVAEILAYLPMDASHLAEVHNAVISSSGNGYDEEYTMSHLFEAPGSGVGENIANSNEGVTKVGGIITKGTEYKNPLRDLICDYVRGGVPTKSSARIPDPDKWLDELQKSDMQIYWPFSENWDGETFPVVTFDPEDNSDVNIGYRIAVGNDGSRYVEEVLVNEEMAENMPVWVVNRNSDAGFTTLEMLRREDPEWGAGGGSIIVTPAFATATKASDSGLKSLMLKDFTMKRNYDTWFTGASEFFVKTGAVEDFTASTEAELRLYSPTVTDFVIVVRRNQIGIPQPFNAVLISEWSQQLESCAFMIIEDDGGTIEDWNCTALVRVASKSYGVEIKIPFHSRDDIVWRGQLTSRWLEANSNLVGHFGDIDLTFEVLEY
ncbi:MAG: hypothetical protein IKW55_01620 [Bacteroidales bacterium]|nr:hypothetical protein [Bacteroidales bacterium]